MARLIAAPNLLLPWSSTLDDDRRYRKIFIFLLVPFIIFGIAIPLISVPEKDREELEKLPPQLAKVVLEKKELPKPTPKPKPKPTPKPEVEKEEPKKEEPKKEEPKKEEPKPKKEPDPVKIVEKAREQAQAEINQFADALSEMRDLADLSDVSGELTQGTGEAAELSRDVITSGAKRGSGGINTSNLSRDTGGVALSGKKTTAVASKLDVGVGASVKPKSQQTAAERSSRSHEEIRKVMDRNKAAIYNIYNRALRKNPALEGKVVFKLEIDSTGKVISAQIVSSDLNDPALERRLLARIRLINFGSKDVLKTTLNYDMDFLPY